MATRVTDKPATDPETDALLVELGRLADDIAVAATAQDERYARRLALYQRLIDGKGVTQAKVAAAAKVTPMAVSYVLQQERKRREAKGAKRKGRAK